MAADPTAGAEDTSVTVIWDEPASGAPESYNVYRSSTATPTFPDDYTMVGTVAGDADTLEFVDTGLTADTDYTYAVTAVDQGDESTRTRTP